MIAEAPDPLDHMPRQGIVFGAVETKPVRTSLPGKLTLHVCLGEFVRADVEHDGQVRSFMVTGQGDHWELCLEHPPGCHYRAAQ